MKRFLLFAGLAGVTLLLAQIMVYVAEYYELRWTRVESRLDKLDEVQWNIIRQ